MANKTTIALDLLLAYQLLKSDILLKADKYSLSPIKALYLSEQTNDNNNKKKHGNHLK